MRELKFRGKTLNEGEWIYGMTISHGTIARKKNNLYMEVAPDKWKGIDPETVGQFTGLLDRNGKEIYEGDILVWGAPLDDMFPTPFEVSDDNPPCICQWNSNESRFAIDYYDIPVNDTDVCNAKDLAEHYKVIGNIHDNPEQLKGGRG